MSIDTKTNYPEGSLKAMLELVRKRPNFRLILISNMISQLGDWLSYIAISLITLSSGEGGLALASAYLVHTLPSAFMAPFTGRVADRYDRRKVMIGVAIFASLLTVCMCISAHHQNVWLLQGFTLIRTCLSAFGVTARQAAIPSLVDQKELYTANALSSVVWSTLFAVGVALGGFLAASVGATTAIAIDAFTFIASLLVIWQLPPLLPQATKMANKHSRAQDEVYSESIESTNLSKPNQLISHQKYIDKSSFEDSGLNAQSGLWACWQFARKDHRLAVSLLAKCPLGLINSAGWMILSLYASLTFKDESGLVLGLFHASRAVGTGVGPLVFQKIWPNSVVKSSVWASLTVIVLLWSDRLWLSVLSLFFFGALLGYTWVRSSALVQHYAPGAILGRLTAFDYSASIACQATSILCIGAVYDYGWGLDLGIYLMIGLTLLIGFWLIAIESKDNVLVNTHSESMIEK